MSGRFFVFSHDAAPGDADQAYVAVLRDFWIVEIHGIDPEMLTEAFELLYRGSRGQGFVLFQPWWPGTQHSRELFSIEFPSCRRLNGEMWVDGESSAVSPSRLLHLRKTLGSSRSGLWLMGIAADAQKVAQSLTKHGSPVGSPSGLAIESADSVDAAVAFDEGGVTTVLLRRTSGAAEQLEAFLSSLISFGLSDASQR